MANVITRIEDDSDWETESESFAQGSAVWISRVSIPATYAVDDAAPQVKCLTYVALRVDINACKYLKKEWRDRLNDTTIQM